MSYNLFDFATYMAQWPIDGSHEVEIEQLSGGNTNHTVRVKLIRKSAPPASHPNVNVGTSDFPGFASILQECCSAVLKQAPPYIAKSPDMPFAQSRQFIEAKALSLLHSTSSAYGLGLAQVLELNPSIRVPRLLYHDTYSYVLMQSDLGPHPTLETFLRDPSTSSSTAAVLGEALGRFLANLHSAANLNTLSVQSCQDFATAFSNPDADLVMNLVITNAQGFMKDAGISDWNELGQLALRHWQTRKKTVFGQGDIWFGTILVEDTKIPGELPTIGICDWEFAGPNHAAADIAQLGCYLHLQWLSADSSSSVRTIVHSFAESLYQAYFSTARISSDSPRPDLLPEFNRSLIIMHGWELVNAAAWRHYLWCECPGEGVKCPHIVKLVEEGARLLRSATLNDTEVDWPSLESTSWVKFFRMS